MGSPRHLLLAMAAACASATPGIAALPDYLSDPEATPHPDCPPATSFLAVGSAREGREAAAQRARAAVARRISSRIEVETVRILQTSRKGGDVRQSRELTERISEKATFEHDNLVRIVGAAAERGGETFVLACLDRGELARVLQTELDPALVRFRTAAGEALRAGAGRAAFVLGYAAARREVPAIVRLLAQLHVAAGRDADGEDAFRAGWTGLLEEAGRLRGSVLLRLSLEAQDLPADGAGEVTEAVRSALVATGLRTELGSPTCEGATYLLHLRASPTCRWGSLGHTCRLDVSAEATDCGDARTVFAGPIAGGAVEGIDARDERRALRRALGHLTAQALGPPLRRMLATEIPLAEAP